MCVCVGLVRKSDGHSEGVGLCCKVQGERICDDPVTGLNIRHHCTRHKGHTEKDCKKWTYESMETVLNLIRWK